MSYTWYVGGRRVADAPEASTELVLDHVDRRLHNHVVRCEVTNPIGKTDESALLNVACKLIMIKYYDKIICFQHCFRSIIYLRIYNMI